MVSSVKAAVLLILTILPYCGYSEQVMVDFYGQDILFQYDESIIIRRRLRATEEDLRRFHETMLKSRYQDLVKSLLHQRMELQLNDWLYYLLIEKLGCALDKRHTNADYLKWFLLAKSGYKVRIAFSKGHVSVFVESTEDVFGLPKYGNSYCINCGGLNLVEHDFPRYNPYIRDNRMVFSFFFYPLPKFPKTSYVSRRFQLPLLEEGVTEQMKIEFDSILLKCQDDIDGFNLQQAFSVPFTQNARRLLDRIDQITSGHSDSMRVTYLMDFVTRNSRYAIDDVTFKRHNKFATPEEFLFHKKGDCEDRSSFMYYALKEILRKPIVILEYPEERHMNVAVSIDLNTAPDFIYKGKPYYICETTTSRGFIPLGKVGSIGKYRIVGEYWPESDVPR